MLSSLEGSGNHPDQAARCPARIHHPARRSRGRQRYHPQRQSRWWSRTIATQTQASCGSKRTPAAGEVTRSRRPDRRDRSRVINQATTCIATLTEDVPFVMEMVVENGRGYIPASASTDRQRDRKSASSPSTPPTVPVTSRSATRSKRPASARRPTTTSSPWRSPPTGRSRIRRWRWSNRPRSSASTSTRSSSTPSWAPGCTPKPARASQATGVPTPPWRAKL